MQETIKIDSFIHVPVENLTADYNELLAMLTFTNPEYSRQGFVSGGFRGKVPEKHIKFYRLDRVQRHLLLPRNISNKYYIYNNINKTNICEGVKIGTGLTKDFRLREYQADFFATEVMPHLDKNKNAPYLDILLDCECGSGKTIMSLYIASKYRRNTLVAVTKRPIGNQFIKEVKSLFPNWTVGWYEEGKTFDITIATYSLLSQDSYTPEFFSGFGHLILDEYHRVGAGTYATILEKAACKYRTSLTATFRRKDGLEKALAYHVGKQLHMPRRAAKAIIQPVYTDATVNMVLHQNVQKKYVKDLVGAMYSDVVIKNKKRQEIDRGMVTEAVNPISPKKNVITKAGYVVIKSAITGNTIRYDIPDNGLMYLGNVSVSAIDSTISQDEQRNLKIFNLIVKLRKQGRKILVLSKRKEQLFILHKKSIRRGFNSGLIVSAKDREYNEYAKQRGFKNGQEYAEHVLSNVDIIYGIDKLAEEGLDVPSFDTLVYLHPIKDIEQSIGRITRDFEGKRTPYACLLVDDVTVYRNSIYGGKGALAMFKELEHEVMPQINIEMV